MKKFIQPSNKKGRTRSVKSLGSYGCSRDVSPCDSNDTLSISENFESSSSQTSPIIKSITPSLTLTTPNADVLTCPNSPNTPHTLSQCSSDDPDGKPIENESRRKSISRGSKKSKLIREIEVLPEGETLNIKNKVSTVSSTPQKESINKKLVSTSASSSRQVYIIYIFVIFSFV